MSIAMHHNLPPITGDGADWDKWRRVELPLWAAMNKIPEMMDLLRMTSEERKEKVLTTADTSEGGKQHGWSQSQVRYAAMLAAADQLLGASLILATEDTSCGVTHLTRDQKLEMSGAAMIEVLDQNFSRSHESAMDEKTMELELSLIHISEPTRPY